MARHQISVDLDTYKRLNEFTQSFYVFPKDHEVKLGDHITFSRHTDPLLQRKVVYLEIVRDKKVVSMTRALQNRSSVPFTTKSGTGSFTKYN